jgi:hypothetical protein
MMLDVLFYSLLVWLGLYIMQVVRGKGLSLMLIAKTLPLNILLAACLWFSYSVFEAHGFFGSYAYIGRGHLVAVLVDGPTSGVNSVEGFSPIVSIPLGHLIERYGDPNYVRLDPKGPPNAPAIGMALYWDSIRMSVQLPQTKNKSYVVKRTTDVEMIIFFVEELYSDLSKIPFGAEKVVWRGYGSYQP